MIARSVVAAAAMTLALAGTSAATPTPRQWPVYGGSYANTRHFDGDQINASNVASLKLAWSFGTGVYGTCESSPLVVRDTLYLTTGLTNEVFALEARSGRLKWRYTPRLGPAHAIFRVNRGVAADDGRIFLATIDARLIALDAATGKPVWDVRIGDPGAGYSETMAPLAWNGLVFVGSSGGEYGIRGSFSAYSQRDGRLVWRWWTVSPGWEGRYATSVNGLSLHRDVARERAAAARYRDAWRHGGGPIWMTPALSPEDGALILSTGNPSPNYNGDARPGDNLYTDSIVALDARTGRMRWYYQETPHDRWDYDAASPPVLFDALDATGRRVPAVGEAGKTGWYYILDRRNGRPIRISQPFVPQHDVFGPAGGNVTPSGAGGAIGGVAYDPAFHAVFVGATALSALVEAKDVPPWPGGNELWEAGSATIRGEPRSLLSRIDVDTGRVVWQYRTDGPSGGGVLVTGGVVFWGELQSGTLDAFDARTGKLLWHVQPSAMKPFSHSISSVLGDLVWRGVTIASRLWDRLRKLDPQPSDAEIHAPPIAYELGGKEYIAIAADLPYSSTRVNGGDSVYVFSL
jgi:PQQ-dependent dehydrogenase (methanol/ethanol family)